MPQKSKLSGLQVASCAVVILTTLLSAGEQIDFLNIVNHRSHLSSLE